MWYLKTQRFDYFYAIENFTLKLNSFCLISDILIGKDQIETYSGFSIDIYAPLLVPFGKGLSQVPHVIDDLRKVYGLFMRDWIKG